MKEHTLFFVPNRLDQDFTAIADEVDCFIITGGDDRLIRRTTELKLATQMMLRNKPILGVCHGCFLLTDTLGGTVLKKAGHSGGITHDVNYKGQKHQVNSFHGLNIKLPQHSATVLATDDDGDCEAWIDGNVAGVVWHPERTKDHWLPDEIQNLMKL